MITEKIKVSNLMCSGCAKAIQNELLKISNIKSVNIDIENNLVTISYEHIDRRTISELLKNIGYPEVINN